MISFARPWRAARAAALVLALASVGLATSSALPEADETSGAATAAVAAPDCGTGPSAQRLAAEAVVAGASDPDEVTPAQSRASEDRLQARLSTLRERARSGRAAKVSRHVDVYVHVITKDNGKGDVGTRQIKDQIEVLNRAYAGKTSKYSAKSGFTFELEKIDRTPKSSWYYWEDPDESTADDVDAKTALHQGGFDDLNLYVTSLKNDLLGYATFPDQTTTARDGVVVSNASLPGGPTKHYSRGDTAVHEVGHWLGLYHTFQDGCRRGGDLVADTPAQDDGLNVLECRKSLDTCPAKGKDPVHNFMNYSDDKCMTRFTKGQVARMVDVWEAYRAPGAPG